MHSLRCNPDRIAARIDALAAMTEPERPWTRLVFSPQYDTARNWLENAFAECELATSTDAAGNLVGTLAGSGETGHGAVGLGSHIDTVAAGGRFDGIAGVIAALEVAQTIRQAGISLPFDLKIIDFLGEELNGWGTSCLGSRGLGGGLNTEMLSRADETGRILGAEIRRIGGDPDALDCALPWHREMDCFLELHIEQSVKLEQSGGDIGIVTAIPMIERHQISISGTAGHSGTVPMAGRRDALADAAGLISRIRDMATRIATESNQHFVATIGKLTVLPNAASIIAEQVELVLDLRSEGEADRGRFMAWLEAEISALPEAEMTALAASSIAPMDNALRQRLADAADHLGYKHQPIASGAGHDAGHVSRLLPAALIFIPCRDGLSHCPQEFATSQAISRGADVLLHSVLGIAADAVAGLGREHD